MTENLWGQLPALYKEASGADTNVTIMCQRFNELKDNPDYIFVAAATDSGELVGFMSGIVNHDIVEQGMPFLTIWNIRTKGIYRRRGIGKTMMAYLENEAKKLGCDFIALISGNNRPESHEFYKALHFEEMKGFVKHI